MIETFGDWSVLLHIKCTVIVNVAFLYTLQIAATCNCSALCSHVYNWCILCIYRQRADIKICMAKAVVEDFSFLKDEEGKGFVSVKCTSNTPKNVQKHVIPGMNRSYN